MIEKTCNYDRISRLRGAARRLSYLRMDSEDFLVDVAIQTGMVRNRCLTERARQIMLDPNCVGPSSRGPGRGPLKAKTGVRISLGALKETDPFGAVSFYAISTEIPCDLLYLRVKLTEPLSMMFPALSVNWIGPTYLLPASFKG